MNAHLKFETNFSWRRWCCMDGCGLVYFVKYIRSSELYLVSIFCLTWCEYLVPFCSWVIAGMLRSDCDRNLSFRPWGRSPNRRNKNCSPHSALRAALWSQCEGGMGYSWRNMIFIGSRRKRMNSVGSEGEEPNQEPWKRRITNMKSCHFNGKSAKSR